MSHKPDDEHYARVAERLVAGSLVGSAVPFLGAGVNMCDRPESVTPESVVDDFDGSPAVETVRYSYAGRDYEIDLNEEHAREFDEFLAKYIEHSREVERAQPEPQPRQRQWEPGKFLPSGSELAAYLAQRYRWPAPNKAKELDLLRVSQYVDVMLGSGPLYDSLHAAFATSYTPTRVHRLLALLPALIRSAGGRAFPLLVTTNYDNALERAFEDVGEDYDLITYIAEGSDRGRFEHTSPSGDCRVITVPNRYSQLGFNERPVIAKIHGAVSLSPEHDSFVVTEDHYIDYLRHADLTKLIPVNVLARMRKSHFLFLGYSLRDWNLRVILNRLWRDSALTYKSWAIQKDQDDIEERSWARQHVDLLVVQLEEYVEKLGDKLGVRLSEPPQTGVVV